MKKPDIHTKLSDTLTLSECKDGFWLYDTTRGMNLSMRANSPTDAFVEALEYYQRRLKEVETSYFDMRAKVDVFVAHFADEGK